MTKGELIEALQDFDDYDDVVMYVEGLDAKEVSEVRRTDYGEIAIVNSDPPSTYDLSTYAEAYYNKHGFEFGEREAFEAWKGMMA